MFFAAEVQDGAHSAKVMVDDQTAADAAVAGYFLDDQYRVECGHVPATILLREGHAKPTLFNIFLNLGPGNMFFCIPPGSEWGDLFFGKLAGLGD